ncbi:MAG: chromate resistance protein [Deltaproteobacteria bacterium]|nr:chromate resistance protein [Deltaproteobacteria bacterium]
MKEGCGDGWLLLIHQIPPKPNYFRVKIWRRLQRLGAVAVKNSVYVLPKNDQTLEDFQWVLREIVEGGGEASVCEARFVEGLSDDQVQSLFQIARDADYSQLAEEARRLLETLPADRKVNDDQRAQLDTNLVRLKRRLAEVVAIDFFDAPGRLAAEGLIQGLESPLGRTAPGKTAVASGQRLEDFRSRIWVTRKGIHIDRIASAWLICRFIDPEALGMA